MKPALLDLNVLTALLWPAHEHHDAAHRWFADGVEADASLLALAQRNKGVLATFDRGLASLAGDQLTGAIQIVPVR